MGDASVDISRLLDSSTDLVIPFLFWDESYLLPGHVSRLVNSDYCVSFNTADIDCLARSMLHYMEKLDIPNDTEVQVFQKGFNIGSKPYNWISNCVSGHYRAFATALTYRCLFRKIVLYVEDEIMELHWKWNLKRYKTNFMGKLPKVTDEDANQALTNKRVQIFRMQHIVTTCTDWRKDLMNTALDVLICDHEKPYHTLSRDTVECMLYRLLYFGKHNKWSKMDLPTHHKDGYYSAAVRACMELWKDCV